MLKEAQKEIYLINQEMKQYKQEIIVKEKEKKQMNVN